MIFNSIDFAVFLPIVYSIYWILNQKAVKYQNVFIIISSYFFYGWWDYRFLFLIFFSTVIDYFIGLQLSQEEKHFRRKVYLLVSIIFNLGMLCFFKYFNFFQENFISAFSFFGCELKGSSLNIILPVGISFYTFQTMSYTIDVYRKKLEPTDSFISLAAFVSFFPQLVAGPIERATNLLPQFYNKRKFDYLKTVDGLRQILWGFFKKIVIADNCAEYANEIFNHSFEMGGSTLFLGAIFFTFQIYGDFSGYSDIAIGTSRLFGFNMIRNFAFPYFSRDIAEFWRRWHISLSTWFRDYLYIPLGGSNGGVLKKIRNTFLIFIISGFWHGANWTFIFWGVLNAVFFLPLLLTQKNRKNLDIVAKGKLLPTLKEFYSILLTFFIVVLGWIFFRAENIAHAVSYIKGIFTMSLFDIPSFKGIKSAFFASIFIGFFLLVEWLGRENEYAIESFGLSWNRYLRYIFYYTLVFTIFWFGGKEHQFIYFQF